MSAEANPVPASSGQPAKAPQQPKQQQKPNQQNQQQKQQQNQPKQQKQKPKAEPKPAGPEIELENKDLPTYVDTHCHIPYILDKMHLANYQELRQKTKYPANYEASVCVFCDPAAFSPSFATWPDLLKEPDVYGAFGIHPHNAKYYTDKVEEQIAEAMKHPKAVAWGECGLDYHYNNSPPEDQKRVFARQCAMAVALGKPLVVHSREADDDTFDILQKSVPKDWRIHLHCFGSTAAVAKRLTDEFPNLFIGITGVVTFGSAKDQKEAVIATPLDRLLLETDSPYMMPTKARKPGSHVCHPGHIPWVAAEIASLKGVTMEEVYKQIRENTKKMYGI